MSVCLHIFPFLNTILVFPQKRIKFPSQDKMRYAGKTSYNGDVADGLLDSVVWEFLLLFSLLCPFSQDNINTVSTYSSPSGSQLSKIRITIRFNPLI